MWLRRLDRRCRLYIVPYQWTWVLERVDLTPEQCQQAAWAVIQDDTEYKKYQGAAAIHVALGQIMGMGLLGYRLYKLQPNKLLQDRVYRWVAEHRLYFPSTTPAIKLDPPWQPDL